MVNRIWQWHFGEALVRTPNNWGKTGEKPTHPELLDYLAKRFIESGWSVKAMHRMILLSSTYQMSSQRAEGSARGRSRQPAVVAIQPRPHVGGADPRQLAGARRHTGPDDRRFAAAGAPMKGKRPSIDPDEMTRRTLYIPVRRGSIPHRARDVRFRRRDHDRAKAVRARTWRRRRCS